MTDVVAHPGAQNQTNQASRALVHCYERTFGVECAAAGKAHNIVQKSQRPAKRTILVVDLRIHMSTVSRSDYRGGRLVVLLRPAPDFDFGVQSRAWLQPIAQR